MSAIDCQHRDGSHCAIAAGLAGLDRVSTATHAACAYCTTRATPPRARNKVTCDLAVSALRQKGWHADARALMAAAHDIYPPALDKSSRLAAIEAGDGVGSHLWRLLASLEIKHTAACSCLGLAEEMNALGPAGCRRERARLVAGIRRNAPAYGWGDVAKAAGRALLTGLAWRLDLADVYGSLLDEAIRRTPTVARTTVLSVPAATPAVPVSRETPASGTVNTVDRATPPKPPQRLLLSCRLCPGDLLTMTAAVESLHLTYPGEYETDVRTPHPAIWAHNPRLTKRISGAAGVRTIEMHYPSIQRCNQESVPFLAGYTEHLGEQLGRPLRLRVNRPYLYQSAEELARPLAQLWPGAPNLETLAGRRPIWLVVAGLKNDYTCKGWPLEYYQEVVDRTSDRICWVQIGLRQHQHPELRGVVSLLDCGPPMRETILLAHRAAGGLGPVTFLQHLMAAWQRPYICLVGGREPATWVQYPFQHTLHTVGTLDCCREKSCWKARVVKLPDSAKHNNSLCAHPVTENLDRPAPACLVLIQPSEVVMLLDRLVT